MYNKCFYKEKALAYVEKVWKFKTDADKEKNYEISFVDSNCLKLGKMEAVVERYSCAETEYALRIYVTIGDINFMVDKIKAKENICVYSNFCFENSKGAVTINVADKSKLVVRNGNEAFKFFRLYNTVDGNDMLPTAGLTLPDGSASNGVDMSMNFYTGLHKEGLCHTTVFCICTGESATIPHWHMKPTEDGGFIADPKDHINSFVLYADGDEIKVKDSVTGEILSIDLTKYI